jgi:hypothetical protein
MFVELNDKNKTVINNFFNVQLNTTDIDNITLSYQGTELEVQADESLLIEHYVKNESEITTNERNPSGNCVKVILENGNSELSR